MSHTQRATGIIVALRLRSVPVFYRGCRLYRPFKRATRPGVAGYRPGVPRLDQDVIDPFNRLAAFMYAPLMRSRPRLIEETKASGVIGVRWRPRGTKK